MGINNIIIPFLKCVSFYVSCFIFHVSLQLQKFKGQLQNLPKIFFLGYFNAGFLEPYFWLGTLKKNKEGKKL